MADVQIRIRSVYPKENISVVLSSALWRFMAESRTARLKQHEIISFSAKHKVSNYIEYSSSSQCWSIPCFPHQLHESRLFVWKCYLPFFAESYCLKIRDESWDQTSAQFPGRDIVAIQTPVKDSLFIVNPGLH